MEFYAAALPAEKAPLGNITRNYIIARAMMVDLSNLIHETINDYYGDVLGDSFYETDISNHVQAIGKSIDQYLCDSITGSIFTEGFTEL